MRRILLCILTLSLTGIMVRTASAQDALGELRQDPDKERAIAKALKGLSKYFNSKTGPSKRELSLQQFTQWMEESEQVLGVGVLKNPSLMVELFDQGRAMAKNHWPKIGRGLQYFGETSDNFRGFAYHVPKDYKAFDKKAPSKRWPVIVSMHGRAVNRKHPALRKNFQERGRLAIHDYWLKSPLLQKAIITAPTGLPTGFDFDAKFRADRKAYQLTVKRAITNFRGDWNRVWVETHTGGLRLACSDHGFASGFIVRGGILPKEQFFALSNVTSTPMVYVKAPDYAATAAVVEALTAAYAKADASGYLLVLEGKRAKDGALQTSAEDAQKMADFILAAPPTGARKEFNWRFFTDAMKVPAPIVDMGANFFYNKDQPLEKTAGRVNWKIKREMVDVAGKGQKIPVSRIEIEATECEFLTFMIREDQIPLADPVTVVVNGKVVIENKLIKRDLNWFLENVLAGRFIMMPYTAMLTIEFPLKSEFTDKKEDGKEGADGAEAGANTGAGDDSETEKKAD
ncbi:MAG: hypothetical protein V3T86_00750 [Planctomycetota bacterium]